MEWIIGTIVFIVLAKKGLRAQGKSIEIKESAATIAANVAIEAAELLEIEIKDLNNSKQGKRA